MLLPFTTLPPSDERRFLYTYLGKRMIGAGKKGAVFQPLYVYDAVRARPTFIIGESDSFLLHLAIKDASCGRLVVYIDGHGKRETLNKLYYWCGHQLKKQVYALMPHQDELSHTWNPLFSTKMQIGMVSEYFFNTYRRFAAKKVDRRDLEFQQEAFTLLCRALRGSDIVFNCGDIADFLESDAAFQQLKGSIRGEGVEYYNEFNELRESEDDFEDRTLSLVKYLRLFEKWTLSSYNPSIRFQSLMTEGEIIYAGLPIGWEDNDERKLSSITGNLLVHRLRTLVSHLRMNDRENRRSISLIINKTEAFFDNELVEWITKIRESELMITCALSSTDDLKVMGEKFVEQLRNDTPNIAYFNSGDIDSASWFADLWRHKRMQSGHEVGEDRTWTEKLSHLSAGQYLFESHAWEEKPILMAAPFLPDPPSRPDLQYRRHHYTIDEKPSFRTRYSLIEEERTSIA